jgi:hypothetical protein
MNVRAGQRPAMIAVVEIGGRVARWPASVSSLPVSAARSTSNRSSVDACAGTAIETGHGLNGFAHLRGEIRATAAMAL